MADLRHREHKIQEKRKNTPFRQYLKEIMSHYTFSLYKKNNLITSFAPSFSGVITSAEKYQIRRHEYEKLAQNYNSNIPFLEQIQDLYYKIEHPALATWGDPENSEYAHKIFYSNNCYISFEVCHSENVLYSVNVKDYCTDIHNSMMVGDNSNNIFRATGIFQSSNIFYSIFISNSSDIWFSSNLINCHNCIQCSDLENQSYCIQNKQYNKTEYIEKKEEILKNKQKYTQLYKGLSPQNKQLASTNSDGAFLIKTHNVTNSYFVNSVNGGNNIMFAGVAKGNKNLYDAASCGAPHGDDYYGVVGAGGGNKYYCGVEILFGGNNYYSYYLDGCSYCLGCVGLKNKQFCILNKQYTKEERHILADKIFTQMDSEKTLGNFFPGTMNPFYFNDTAAYLIDDSFTKEEVTAEGYLRRDEKIKVDIPEGSQVVKASELNKYQGFDLDGNRQVDSEILKKVICDEKGNSYRIVKMEYDFLVKHGLPLPEIHWLDRIKLGFKFK